MGNQPYLELTKKGHLLFVFTLFRHLLSRLRQKIRKHLLSDFFIQAAGLAYHHRAKRGAYHQGRLCRPCISSRDSVYFPAAWWYPALRADDIPQRVADDIHAFGVIGMRGCEKLLKYFAKYDIILSKGVIVWRKNFCWSIRSSLQQK